MSSREEILDAPIKPRRKRLPRHRFFKMASMLAMLLILIGWNFYNRFSNSAQDIEVMRFLQPLFITMILSLSGLLMALFLRYSWMKVIVLGFHALALGISAYAFQAILRAAQPSWAEIWHYLSTFPG